MVKTTPRKPPATTARKDVQNGKPVHQPRITSPGSTKITEAMVPAALATVWTMLFSRMFEPGSSPSSAIEITAAGIEVAKVRPTLSPR